MTDKKNEINKENVELYSIINHKKEIVGVYDNLDIALHIILDKIKLQLEIYYDIIKSNNLNINFNIKEKNFKIIVNYLNTNIKLKEIYFCIDKNIFYDNNLEYNFFPENEYSFSNKINDIKSMYNNINKHINNTNNEIFIPNLDTNNNESSDIISDLSQKIERLKNKDNNINTDINNIKKNISKYNTFNSNMFDQKKKIYKNIETRENALNEFNADKDVFNKIKNKVSNNEIEIPELFLDKFPIFKYFDENNIEDVKVQFDYYKNKLNLNFS
tara:strand:- start:672 stop:1487 length:816 start_codon:yes stop_codon:yes gene_type:complete